MELKIMSPQENSFVKEILWNNEELKTEIQEKMQDYKNLVFTEETIKEAKTDRANLRKLRDAFESERKRIKKLCMEPYENFERQVKEVVSLIEEPIQLIDKQIKEVEEQKKLQKRKDIEELFETIGFQCFVTLDKIWDDKWLNVSVPLPKIEEQMKSTMYRIGNDVVTISRLPEFSFEALDMYKKTLDLNQSIREGHRLADIQKRKAAYEEERRQNEAEKARRQEELTALAQDTAVPKGETESITAPQPNEKLYTVEFRVETTKEKLNLLKNFFQLNHITYGPISKKGE